MNPFYEKEEELLLKELETVQNEIVLHNDDVNTFDHVIETLVQVCKHDEIQAEQCATIVHYNGKCTVKTGVLAELKDQCTSLLNAGLSAEII